jgi:hypothetical protein
LKRRTSRELATSPEAKALLDRKIGEYQAQAKKDEAEKEQIKAKAEDLAREYDAINVHDDQFDMTEAGMTVGIAVFGVTALTQKRWLLLVAAFFAGSGIVLVAAGFAGASLHPDWLARLLG